jgi:hypothetical protein
MTKPTEKKDLKRLLMESEDQLKRMKQTRDKIEVLFAEIKLNTGQDKLSLLRDLKADITTAENVLLAQKDL